MLEEEIAYLKKHFDIEVGLIKDENEILKKELQRKRDSLTPNSKYRNTNYCSPIRVLGGMNDMDTSNEKARAYDGPSQMSPFNGMHSSMKPYNVTSRSQAVKPDDKDRIIEAKNKEIIALTLQIEDIISSQTKLQNSAEVEQIRRNLLLEISEITHHLKRQLLNLKMSVQGQLAPQVNRVQVATYN